MPKQNSFRDIAEGVPMPALKRWAAKALKLKAFHTTTKTGVVSCIMRELARQKYPTENAKAELRQLPRVRAR